MGRRHDPVGLSGGETMLSVVLDGPLCGRSSRHHTTGAEREGETVEGRSEIGGGGGGRGGSRLVHAASLFSVTVPPVGDLFDFENLLPELILALGLALLLGNGLAWWRHRHGETPKDVPDAAYRPGRVRFLMVVGLVLTVWGAATLFT
jgi:hypothetical protein